MAFGSCHLKLDLSALPSQSDELDVVFGRGVGNNGKPLLLIFPVKDTVADPGHIRYAVYMHLRLSDGTEAGELGQLVVSGQRLIGMMTHGSADGARLNESAGSVYAFALNLEDIQSARPLTRWTGRVAGVVIHSREHLQQRFVLEVRSVVGALADSGRLSYGMSLADLVSSVTLTRG